MAANAEAAGDRHANGPRIDQARTEAHAAPGRRHPGRGDGIRPAGRGILLIFVEDRPPNRLAEPHRADGEDPQGAVVVHGGLVLDAFDQLAPDARVHRRGEPQPQARQPRRQQRHRNHPAPQPALPRVLAHDARIRYAIGAADLEDAVALRAADRSPPASRPARPRSRSVARACAPSAGRASPAGARPGRE